MLSDPGNLAVCAVELSFHDETQTALKNPQASIIKLHINLKFLNLPDHNLQLPISGKWFIWEEGGEKSGGTGIGK